MKNRSILDQVSADMLLETMAEGVMLISPDGKIQLWNKAMSDLTGYTAEETIGRTTEWLRAPECIGANRIFSLLAPESSSNACINGCECRMIAKSGERIPVMVNARLLKNMKKSTIGILQTITDFRPIINLQQEIAAMASKLQSEEGFEGITGKSAVMKKVFRMISLAADSDATTIILGESGTGKELVADAIQNIGNRRDQPFVKVNCGALPESLLESELFGHEKGSFTSAMKRHIGRFEAAHGGTLFLDEIGEVSQSMQVKLLRVLQTGEFQRVGGENTLKVDVRIIAATNKDLLNEVKEGRFREDLYYRLRVFPITLPPLRERTEDIPILAQHLVNRFSARTGRLISGIDRDAMAKLTRHRWPGNVRELENCIEYAFVVCQQKLISSDDLPPDLFHHQSATIIMPEVKAETDFLQKKERKKVLQDKNLLATLLEDCDWNKAEAGRRLGVSRTAVWKWMLKHKISS